MENWLYASLPVLAQTVISCTGIFLAMLVIVRIAGLRTFAKMSSIDFAATIAIGSVLAGVVMNPGHSLLKGSLALAVIIGLQSLFAWLKRNFKLFNRIAVNRPMLLMKGETILYENLKKTNVSKSDLLAKLREANVTKRSQVLAVVFETTGDISVLHSDDPHALEEWIMEGVSES